MVALMQPSARGEDKPDKWYREEHNQQMSEQFGWRRTCRYSLLSSILFSSFPESDSNSNLDGRREEKGLRFPAIHEFGEGEQLGEIVKAVEPVSAWTKKIMSEAVGIDAAIYRRVD
jgi:hypothetical protein